MNAARTGRKPTGPQIVERLEGSPSAKQRLEVILETIAGQLTIPEACARLSICESRFHDLRNQTLQATLNTLEPRRPGRPPKRTSPEQGEINTLKAELDRAHRELAVADVQVNLARIHPDLLEGPPPPEDPACKKNARPAR
jgi:transposase-like protein